MCNALWFGVITSAWTLHETTECEAIKRTEGRNHLCLMTRPIRKHTCIVITKDTMTILNEKEDFNVT